MENAMARGGLVSGILITSLGMLLLVQQITGVNPWGVAWPFFIIIPGLLLLIGMVAGGRVTAPLAVPGSVVTAVGTLLFYQNIFDYYQSWAYAWTLIVPTAVGVGLLLYGVRGDQPVLRQIGLAFTGGGLVLFVILATCFEIGVFNHNPLGRLGWTFLVLVIGLALTFGCLALLLGKQARATIADLTR